MPTNRLFAFGAFTAAALSAAAQPAAPSHSLEFEYAYSSREDLDRRGPAGAVGVHQVAFDFADSRPQFAADGFSYGLSARLITFDASPGTPLPDELNAVSLNLGFKRSLSPQWSLNALVRPGLYGDFATIDSKTFNAPLLLSAAYARSRDLVWLFGLGANVHAERPVLPLAGVRWRFAARWSLNVTYPRSGVEWRASDTLTLDAGVSLQGGTFRITDSPGTPAGLGRRIANTFVDYSEIRLGVGASFVLRSSLTLRVGAGMFVDREFDYFDRDYTLDGDGGLYASLALSARF